MECPNCKTKCKIAMQYEGRESHPWLSGYYKTIIYQIISCPKCRNNYKIRLDDKSLSL